MTTDTAIQPDLSIQDAARLLSCSQKHVYALISEGALHRYKIGRTNRVTRDSIEQLRKHGHDRHRCLTSKPSIITREYG